MCVVLCNIMLKYVHFSVEMLPNFSTEMLSNFCTEMCPISIQFISPCHITFKTCCQHTCTQFPLQFQIETFITNFSSQHHTCTQTRSAHTHTISSLLFLQADLTAA